MKFDSNLTVVDIFSGAGGLSEGFKQAGFDVLLGVDNYDFAVETFRNQHGHAIQYDVRKLTAARIKKGIGNRNITVLTAGPPCQAFSSVAVAKLKSLKQNPDVRHPLNVLYREFLRLVKGLQPPFFVMENVGRMFSIENGSIKKEIEKELKGQYKVDFYYENVSDFGVPQARRRGIAIGNRLGIENPVFVPTHFDPKKESMPHGMKKYVAIRDAISDLPKLKIGEGEEFVSYPEIDKRTLSSYAKERRINSEGVFNHTARKHGKKDLKIFKMLKPGQWISDLPKNYNRYRRDIFLDKYKKQSWNKPSSTILAHLSKDGLMFIHPDNRQNRSFTPREAARLQSFDDDFVFAGPRTEQFIQIGNAVPPLFGKVIAEGIKESMKIKCAPVIRKNLSHNRR